MLISSCCKLLHFANSNCCYFLSWQVKTILHELEKLLLACKKYVCLDTPIFNISFSYDRKIVYTRYQSCIHYTLYTIHYLVYHGVCLQAIINTSVDYGLEAYAMAAGMANLHLIRRTNSVYSATMSMQ